MSQSALFTKQYVPLVNCRPWQYLIHSVVSLYIHSLGSTGPKDGGGGFGLEFPANGIINASNPTPCTKEDSREYGYIEGTLDLIAELGLDASKVYFEGFSQSSMFAAYASVCFADRVAGLWQGGSGLAKTYHTPIVPGFQAQCSASDYNTYGNSCCEGKKQSFLFLPTRVTPHACTDVLVFSSSSCRKDNFCTDCTWWPIYPRTCENKLVDCIATYTNDNIACGSDFYMYEAMVAEGHDARMLSFSPTNGVAGGHSNPQNTYSWIVGCLGIVDSCSESCEASFLSCMQTTSVAEFARCEIELKNGDLADCEIGCAPTLEMLKTSQTPVVNLSNGKFGSQEGLDVTESPQRPNCSNDFGPFLDGSGGNCSPPAGDGPASGDIEECPSTSSCVDSTLEFKKGKKVLGCSWVAKKTETRCKEKFASHCPSTCGACSTYTCVDSSRKFKLSSTSEVYKKCPWAKNDKRCKKPGVVETCRKSCSSECM